MTAAAAELTIEKAKLIAVGELHPALWNVNRVKKSVLKKIAASIERYGYVENMVARPHPDGTGYEVLSGNHRLTLLAELGIAKVPVVIVDVDDNRARILAQTLNRTRGRDDPLAYRALVQDLMAGLPTGEITEVLTEDERSLQDLIGQFVDRGSIIDTLQQTWGIVVACKDKGDQNDLIDRMREAGYVCRPVMKGSDE